MAAGRATQEFLQLCVRPPLHPAQAITDLILCIMITYNTWLQQSIAHSVCCTGIK
jgi:hypothetical protein